MSEPRFWLERRLMKLGYRDEDDDDDDDDNEDGRRRWCWLLVVMTMMTTMTVLVSRFADRLLVDRGPDLGAEATAYQGRQRCNFFFFFWLPSFHPFFAGPVSGLVSSSHLLGLAAPPWRCCHTQRASRGHAGERAGQRGWLEQLYTSHLWREERGRTVGWTGTGAQGASSARLRHPPLMMFC